MYANLLNHSKLEDSTDADIVKSSYWLYYDYEDGNEPTTDVPNLTKYMPRELQVLEGDSLRELLFHHPSIWSAIYRREFIEDCLIRMIEPKGAGWADNPWFFDTILRAKSIVWWPHAYYYYRQTNPNASSKSPALNLAFDRLRDMRQIVKDLEKEKDDKIAIPFYNRSFCYILDSVLGEYGYPESDPEVQSLIREVLASMDRKTVLEAPFGIPEEHKSYYRDVMGLYLEELHAAAKPSSPLLTVVIAMNNDHQDLWPTLRSLTHQIFRNFEVVCVDTGSHNRFAEIIEAVSMVDERFSLVQLGEEATVADAFNAGLDQARGEYVQFWRPGLAYPFHTDLGHIFKQARRQEDFIDLSSCSTQSVSSTASSFASRPFPSEIVVMTEHVLGHVFPKMAAEVMASKSVSVVPDGVCGEIVAFSGGPVFGKLFSRSFLQGASLSFFDGDVEGRVFFLSALAKANLVTVVRGGSTAVRGSAPDCWQPFYPRVFSADDRTELLDFCSDTIDLLANHAAEYDDKEAAYVNLVEVFSRAFDFVFDQKGGRAYFESLATKFHAAFADADLSSIPQGDREQCERLNQVFSRKYTSMLERELRARGGHSSLAGVIGSDKSYEEELERSLADLQRRLTALKNSYSYRLGVRMTRSLRRVVPEAVIGRLKNKT